MIKGNAKKFEYNEGSMQAYWRVFEYMYTGQYSEEQAIKLDHLGMCKSKDMDVMRTDSPKTMTSFRNMFEFISRLTEIHHRSEVSASHISAIYLEKPRDPGLKLVVCVKTTYRFFCERASLCYSLEAIVARIRVRRAIVVHI